MIEIVTGPINSGKSSWMLADFARHDSADGFICVKVRIDGIHTGYDLLRPLDQSRVPFIRKIDYIPEKWDEAARIGQHYSFCTQGFDFAAQITREAIADATQRFYLDEIGPLELSGRGFALILQQLQHNNSNLIIAVRETLLADVIQCFALHKPRIVKPEF